MSAAKLVLKFALILLAVVLLLLAGVVLFMPGLHISSLSMVLNVMTGAGGDSPNELLLERLEVAPGYHVSVFARDLPNPRILHLDTAGGLLVSNPRSGEIIRMLDQDGDGAADQRQVLMSGLQRPQGIESLGQYLYVGESHQVIRVPWDAEKAELTGSPEVVVPNLTDNGNHWSKILRFGPDDTLYVAMGSTCNVCEEEDERRATIMRYDADGSNGAIFAAGIRNSVGLDFAPWSGALYATDNGRDLLGDDYPPCELNEVVEGGFYGWPYLNGANELDPDFGAGQEALQETAIAPVFDFRAHNAPLGIYFPQDESRTALVALHGSWNRSTPDRYKVLRLHWGSDGEIMAEDFIWGFEQDGDIVGRPVDIASDGDGGFFISDDFARVIYRVSPRDDFGSAAAAGAEAIATNSAAIDAELAQAGEALYNSMPCAACHSPEAPTPIILRDLEQRYTLVSLAQYFTSPTPPMPLYDLSDEQRQQLAHYLISQERSQAEK